MRARYPTLAILAAGRARARHGYTGRVGVRQPGGDRGSTGVMTGQLNRSRPITRPQRAAYRHAAATRDALKHVGDYLTNTGCPPNWPGSRHRPG